VTLDAAAGLIHLQQSLHTAILTPARRKPLRTPITSSQSNKSLQNCNKLFSCYIVLEQEDPKSSAGPRASFKLIYIMMAIISDNIVMERCNPVLGIQTFLLTGWLAILGLPDPGSTGDTLYSDWLSPTTYNKLLVVVIHPSVEFKTKIKLKSN